MKDSLFERFATEGVTVTMPSENYLYFMRRIEELEREMDFYREECNKLGITLDNCSVFYPGIQKHQICDKK